MLMHSWCVCRRCIVIMDSLGDRSRKGVCRILRRYGSSPIASVAPAPVQPYHTQTRPYSYLSNEWKARKGDQDALTFTEANMPQQIVRLPQQNNHCDCGVYIMQYLEQYLLDPFTNFAPRIVCLRMCAQ